eukprot:NODE_29_length_33183_cov_0.333666.p11 type:complete len:247 gc:universal NODE_29_length_33183_cov_0.333666:29238-28498(-)
MGSSTMRENGVQGLYAGVINTLLLQPFDVLRTLQQQSHTKFLETIKMQCNSNILGFYRGTVSTLYRNSIGYALYFNFIKEYQKVFSGTFVNNMAIGCTSRGSVGLLLAPLTFLKTRFESTNFNYKSIRGAVTEIYTREGVKTFYSALSATLSRDVLYSGLYFALYQKAKKEYSVPVSATISALAALALTHHLDTIKTKMQIDPKRYKSMRQTYQGLSLRLLYSGFLPRSLRRVVQAVVAWSFFESL